MNRSGQDTRKEQKSWLNKNGKIIKPKGSLLCYVFKLELPLGEYNIVHQQQKEGRMKRERERERTLFYLQNILADMHFIDLVNIL